MKRPGSSASDIVSTRYMAPFYQHVERVILAPLQRGPDPVLATGVAKLPKP